jgi:hypothetical protein
MSITFNSDEKTCRWNGILMDDETCRRLFGVDYEDEFLGDTYIQYGDTLYVRDGYQPEQVWNEYLQDYVRDISDKVAHGNPYREHDPDEKVVIDLQELVYIVVNIKLKTEAEYYALFTDYKLFRAFTDELKSHYSRQ